MNGVPSIVIGIFAFEAIVRPTHRASGPAASTALAVLMLPIMVRANEEAIRSVPTDVQEAGAALGASRWRVVRSVVLRTSLPGASGPPPPALVALCFEDVSVSFGGHMAVRGVTLQVPVRRVTTLVGPSGCGKTTLLRAVNRMHDHVGGRVEGHVRLGELDVYGAGARPELVRSRVGMVFQRPNPFPTMSIFDNVVSGLRFAGTRNKAQLRRAAEAALRQAALWDLVEHRLGQSALQLSGGQQQRLCIARALAVQPEVLLMDEPCSALDPIATAKVEQLITSLARDVTVVLVTHNMFQAARVSDYVAVMLMGDDRVGELVEAGPAAEVLRTPADPRAMEYVSGRVG